MAVYDCRKLKFQAMKILGVEGLYSDLRVDRKTLPNGIHAYSIRHSDEDGEWFESIENHVLVNHLGDFITDGDVGLNESNNYYREINGDYEFLYDINENHTERLLNKYNITQEEDLI